MMKKVLCTAMSVSLVLLLVASGSALADETVTETGKETSEGTVEPKGSYTIAFAASTLSNEFFVTMLDAAQEYADQKGVTLVYSDAEDDAEKMNDQVQDFITQDVDLIILNPVDSDAIRSATKACNDADIPVITVTRPSNSGEVVQHLDIDNLQVGLLDAEQMIKDCGKEGKIATLEGIAGTPSANDRQQGFADYIKENSDLEIVADLTANYNREEGATVTEDILQGNPDIIGIFAANDEMALGAVSAVKAAGLIDQIKIYGCDATNDALTAIANGEMAATVKQQPDLQIRKAIDSAITYLNGDTVEPIVYIDLKLITPDNVQEELSE